MDGIWYYCVPYVYFGSISNPQELLFGCSFEHYMTKGINQREIKGAVYQNILEGPEHYSTFLCLLVSQIVILSLIVDIFNNK